MDIKDTYRTIKDTQGTTTPAHDDLVFIWCSNIPIDTFIYTTS